MLKRLRHFAHDATDELETSPTQATDWERITKNAQVLLDHMPKAMGMESVLTVCVFLSSLDRANQEKLAA